jgi:hypothetical protein
MVSLCHYMNPQIARTILFAALLAAACLVNVPLGAVRSRQRKFSAKWFLFVHLSIPLIYLLRTTEGFGYWAIPPLIAAAVVGQIIGGRVACQRSASVHSSTIYKAAGIASKTKDVGK